jgi:tetratricopeptide (TPR) repeat protein
VIRPAIIFAMLLCTLSAGAADESTKIKFDSCIGYFTDGEYQRAVDSLKVLLPMIANRHEEAEAYKYLGFSYVMLDMIPKAKDFFRVALEKFPQMTIDTLEVPPNIAIVFKQTELESKMAKGEIVDKDLQRRNEQRIIVASVLTVTGTIAGCMGGYYLYQGYKTHRKYQDIPTADQTRRDSLAGKYSKEYWIGGTAFGFGIINLGLATWLFSKKPSHEKITLYSDPGGIGLVWRF